MKSLKLFIGIIIGIPLLFGLFGGESTEKRTETYCRLLKQYDETGGKAGKPDYLWQRPSCKEKYDWFTKK